MTLFISQSKINTWRQCQKKFQYQYEENLQQKRKARPLKFGSIVHKLAEADAKGEDPFEVLAEVLKKDEKLFREEREMYGDIEADVGYIMRAYFKYWQREPLNFLPKNGHYAEIPFEVPITKEITCKGTIDGIVRAKKMNWLAEHKSHKNFPNTDHRWRNLQSAVYIRIIEMLGWWKLDGTLWDYIRSKPPTRPQLLKSGGLSDRAIDTLPEVIIDTAKAAGLKPIAYQKLVDESRLKLNSWFERVYTPVKKQVVDQVFQDFITTAREIADSQGAKDRPREFGKHCDWCSFEMLCRARMQGLDEDFIKEHEYEQSDYQQAELIIEE